MISLVVKLVNVMKKVLKVPNVMILESVLAKPTFKEQIAILASKIGSTFLIV